jgi:transposase
MAITRPIPARPSLWYGPPMQRLQHNPPALVRVIYTTIRVAREAGLDRLGQERQAMEAVMTVRPDMTRKDAMNIRLCYSRMFLVVAYPRETQEMVFDAHDRGFRFFGGSFQRGIYDNMKTAVDAIFTARSNRRVIP